MAVNVTPVSGPDEKKAVVGRDAEFGGAVRSATSGSDSASVRVDPASAVAAGGSVQPVTEERAPGLPFSKARCIALVATVTGASFLNVRFPLLG
jgi:hypothetical protein